MEITVKPVFPQRNAISYSHDFLYIVRKYYGRIILLFLCLVFPLFFYSGPSSDSSRLLKEFWNVGHFFYFGLLVILVDKYLSGRNRSIFFRVWAAIFVLLVIGLAIELVQLDIDSRTFSWSDVLRDVSGGCAVLCWRISFEVSLLRSVFCRIAFVVILFLNLLPGSLTAYDEYSAYKNFPLLAGFESRLELDRWTGELSRDKFVSVQGDYSAKIRLTTKQYSGVSLHYFPGDWSGWKSLVFSVYNPGAPLELHFRVHDSLHTGDKQNYGNRFNGSTVLHGGWNEVIIPMDDILNGPRGRQMDLTKIRGFGLFVIRQKEDRVIYLDNVRLQ